MLFRFKCGDAEDLRDKIKHFLKEPEDLKRYWSAHQGLFTMKDHWNELIRFYGISNRTETITISMEEWSRLIKENDFLHRHVAGNREYFAKDATIEELRERLEKARKESEMLRKEMMQIKKITGKVMFRTDYIPVQGTVGANLFKLILPDFNYSDLYAEIRFVRLMNVDVSHSDTLCISGTWQVTEGGLYSLTLHQADWMNGGSDLADWIYFYIRDNSIYFFGCYPGKASGYYYKIEILTSRAQRDEIRYEALSEGFVDENEMGPEDAVKALNNYSCYKVEDMQ